MDKQRQLQPSEKENGQLKKEVAKYARAPLNQGTMPTPANNTAAATNQALAQAPAAPTAPPAPASLQVEPGVAANAGDTYPFTLDNKKLTIGKHRGKKYWDLNWVRLRLLRGLDPERRRVRGSNRSTVVTCWTVASRR